MLVDQDKRIEILNSNYSSEEVSNLLNTDQYLIVDNDQFLRMYYDSFKHKDQYYQMMDFLSCINLEKLETERRTGVYRSFFNLYLQKRNVKSFDDQHSFIIEGSNCYNTLYALKLK